MNQQLLASTQVSITPSKKMRISTTIRIILYFIYLLIVEMGVLFAGPNTELGSAGSFLQASIEIIFHFLIFAGGFVIFLTRRPYDHSLRWSQYLIAIFGVTIITFCFWFSQIPSVGTQKSGLSETFFGYSVVLYGAVLIGIACLKQPLRQRVAESTHRLLISRTAAQMPEREMIARLQEEYKRPESLLLSYLATIKDIELVNIPGTYARSYRIKGALTPSQIEQLAEQFGVARKSPHPNPLIFVSHSSKDNDFGVRLVQDLRNVLGEEAAVWYDVRGGLLGGDNWWHKIMEEVAVRPIFILILSPDAVSSSWVNAEIDLVWAQKQSVEGKRIIPIMYRPCQVRSDISTIQIINFLPPKPYNYAFGELLTALNLPASV